MTVRPSAILTATIILFIVGFTINSMLTYSEFEPSQSYMKDGVFIYETNKMKHERHNAMCITGLRMQRLLDSDIYESIRNNVLDVSKADMFLYGFYSGELDENLLLSRYPELIGAILIPESLIHDIERNEYLQFLPKKWSKSQLGVLQLHHYCQQVLLQRYADLIRKKPYDVIMRARPDMLYFEPLNISKLSTKKFEPELVLYAPHSIDGPKLPPNSEYSEKDGYIYFPWENHYGINDQCLIGSPLSMDIFAHTLYTSFHEESPGSHFIEGHLYNILAKKLNMRILNANFKYILSR